MVGRIHRLVIRIILIRGAGFFCCLVGGGAILLQPAAARGPLPKLETVLHAQAIDQAGRLSKLRSLLLSVDGELVVERYFHGVKATQWANVKSASKSVLSALVGIALDRGHLGSVRDPIGKYFPDYLARADDPAKKTITIEDLLTMRSGLETTRHRDRYTAGHIFRGPPPPNLRIRNSFPFTTPARRMRDLPQISMAIMVVPGYSFGHG